MIVIVDPTADRRAAMAAALGGAPNLEVEGLAQLEDALTTAPSGEVVVLIGDGIEPAVALPYAEKVDRERSGVAVLLVHEVLDPKLLRDALRAGVDDVLTFDAPPEEWSEAIARATARVAAEHTSGAGPSTDPTPGRLVTVFSSKGGCGKSLVASNLAVLAAAAAKERVALIDLDLQSGDLAIMFQLLPALSIYDAAQSSSRLDVDAFRGYLTPHRAGVDLLAAPMEPSLADQVSAAAVGPILDLARSAFPLTIVDTPALFTDQVLAALDRSDLIVLVGSMDVPSVKNLKLAMTTLGQLGHPRDRMRLVLNRADSKVGLRATEVEKSLGSTIDVQIPSHRDVPLSVNQGTPLAITRPKSPIVTAIGELLPLVLPELADTTKPGRFRRR